jgi:hypothetical protein
VRPAAPTRRSPEETGHRSGERNMEHARTNRYISIDVAALITHIDEAIVEVQPDEAGQDGPVGRRCPLGLLGDDGLHGAARLVVEPDPESLRVGDLQEQAGDEDDDQESCALPRHCHRSRTHPCDDGRPVRNCKLFWWL